MGAIGVVLLVAFVIVCVLAILLVLVQDQDNSGMGGMFGGGNSAAFGSHSATVLTKTTGVLVALFFIFALALAFINKKSSSSTDELNKAAVETNSISNTENKTGDWWKDEAKAPVQEEVKTESVVETTVNADATDVISQPVENKEAAAETVTNTTENNTASN